MKWHFLLLLLASRVALAAEWTPPEMPEPREILQEAQADTQAKRYEDALAKFVWFHENALKHAPGMYGVRLSFALSYWKNLADVYPPALEKLRAFRDQALNDVKAGIDLRHTFHDLVSLNRTLDEVEQTKDAFVFLDAEHPANAKEIFSLAEPALVDCEAYELCGKYLTPKPSFQQSVASFHINKGLAKNPKLGGDALRNYADKAFTTETATLIALLVINKRQDEAAEIARDAKKEWDDKAFCATIDDALLGKLPKPFP